LKILEQINPSFLQRSNRKKLFQEIYSDFKKMMESDGEICRRTQEDLIAKLGKDVEKLLEMQKTKNHKSFNFYSMIKT